MAKGNFLTSTVRGKLGEMVGYQNTNSNDKVKQAWRSYVPHISNPKTEGQARQRMIVSNLTQNYAALKEIISRGFEGIKYGGKSYQRFLSLNMKNAGNGPFIPKGTRSTPLPIPGLQVSEGSLIPVACDSIITTQHYTKIRTDLYAKNTAINATTWGKVSQAIIDANTDVRDGDQFTFICVSVTENLEYVYRFGSFVIDSTSEEPSERVTDGGISGNMSYRIFPGGIYGGFSGVEGDRQLSFSMVDPMNDEIPVAGAVIQGRQGDGVNLRSTAYMYVNTNDEEIMQYFTPEMFEVALESYMGTGQSRGTDWPTEPDPEISQVWVKSLVNADILISDAGHTVQVAGLVSSDFVTIKYIVKTVDGVQYLTNTDGSIFTYEGTQVTAAMLSGASATRGLVDINGLAEYNVSNLRSIGPEPQPEPDDSRKKAKK